MSSAKPSSRRTTRAAAAALALALSIAAAAMFEPAYAPAAFPGQPGQSPRADTPNDPEFDRCEPDDPDTGDEDCTSYFEEQFGLFGFSPDSANQVPGVPHSQGATRYADCSQLDELGRAANRAAGDPECAQISGIRADSAWKYSAGSPKVVVAILDTGIRWQARELVTQIHLNRRELPQPGTGRAQPQGGERPCAEFRKRRDANGDRAFNVLDYACDPRVKITAGDSEADDILDASDLIARFSDGTDADRNRHVDDIAGWDYFDDDNDPFDASSCCSASGHGTGRAAEAAAATDNGEDGAGVCPRCQVMPLRIWDTFVAPTDHFAMGVLYAAENGASVVEGAVGGLTNTQFARQAFAFADRRGVALTMVSSDINSANHNYPTNYDEAIYVSGTLPDTAPNETCTGPGGLPGVGDLTPSPPEDLEDGCNQLLGALAAGGVGTTPPGQPITTSFFRNANLTQYGGKADIVLVGSTGSQNTGQASGAAGLLASYGLERFGKKRPLSGNEIRQLLTMTAEDVLPANTGSIGSPDRANAGWDTHFGYGRVNLAAAMQRIADRRIPPEAQLGAPDWFAPVNVDRVPKRGVAIHGRVDAPHSPSGVGGWRVEYACGQDAPDATFAPVPGARGSGEADGVLGRLSKSLLGALATHCDGSVSNDAGRPAGMRSQPFPADPYPDPDPERHAFQIRLTVSEAGDPTNVGRYRKTLFAYRDDGNRRGWPRPIGPGARAAELVTGAGGETPPRLYDLDGDNDLETIVADWSGELRVWGANGRPLRGFNRGQPVRTRPYAFAEAHGVPRNLDPPREGLRAPAIGDIDGDREPEIVATAGEHVYAWDDEGRRLDGFPVSVKRGLSEPCKRGVKEPCFDAADRVITEDNHLKRGFIGSPALADLDGNRRLDVVAASLDQHLYAWDGRGRPLKAAKAVAKKGRYPIKLDSEGAVGAESINTPAIADLEGDGKPEVVIATNEVIEGDPEFPNQFADVFNAFLGAAAGSSPVYAVHGDGTPVDGWPVRIGIAAGDLLPLVLPGHDAAVLDVDGDGDDEVSVSAGTSLAGVGGTRLVDGDGETISSYSEGTPSGHDQGPVINVADYASIGDVLGSGGPQVFKVGIGANGAVNLFASNQNVPFNHYVQAWNPANGEPLPGYPRPTDDFQLVSQPAIARVAGDGQARQALVGTGLYQLHAYGPRGEEAPGWPRFTGGWTQATPAVGDADGDGHLEVAAVTREGWSFLWNTDVPACAGSNEEWWTFHHDERSTANYGADARPPGTPQRLRARRGGGRRARLTWRAPGDAWLCGQASRFSVIASRNRIDEPTDGERVDGGAAGAVGDPQRERIRRARFVAVLYRDEAGNWGHVADTRVKKAKKKKPGGRR